ncbi:MAG: type I methionyl aminopeptidase [bacterium]|nr:type I methionyl aminopeptidase [bacterium]
MGIHIKSEKEILLMRDSGKVLSDILSEIEKKIVVGITTFEIEMELRKLLKKNKVKSPFLGYRGYPAVSCISVNEVVVHGIPSDYIIKDGDIVSVDMGVNYRGFITDAARTFLVGNVSKEGIKLVDITKRSFYEGAKMAVEGNHLYDISFMIQKTVEKEGFSIVRDFVSHGVGRRLHEEPFFQNFGEKGKGPILKYGMCLAVEPMVNQGTYRIKILKDGWTAVTEDGKLSAHYENTVLVGKDTFEILTEKN